MASGEQNITALPVKTNTGVANSDYFMGIDSAEGYQILIRDLAKYIMENYNGSTLAGSAQTPKAAIDALNNKTVPTLTGVNENFNINNTRIVASGNVCILQLDIKVTTAVSLTTSYLKLFDIPNGYGLYAGSDVFGLVYAQLNGIPIVIDVSVNGVYAKALTGTVQFAVNDLLRGSISWVR